MHSINKIATSIIMIAFLPLLLQAETELQNGFVPIYPCPLGYVSIC